VTLVSSTFCVCLESLASEAPSTAIAHAPLAFSLQNFCLLLPHALLQPTERREDIMRLLVRRCPRLLRLCNQAGQDPAAFAKSKKPRQILKVRVSRVPSLLRGAWQTAS
jgi:hypothetical protein